MYYFIIYIILILCLIYFSLTKNQESFTLNDFIPLSNYPDLEILKTNHSVILEELEGILKNRDWTNYDEIHKKDIFRRFSLEQIMQEMAESESKVEEITKEPKWKMFGLLFNKQSIELNEKHCPKTIALLKSIPCISNAGFSCLEPNKSTDVHSDYNHNFYRYQLPLIIPKGNTGFKVNDSIINYKVNEPFIFDDCNAHQAWNYTDKIRVVLICDIDRKI